MINLKYFQLMVQLSSAESFFMGSLIGSIVAKYKGTLFTTAEINIFLIISAVVGMFQILLNYTTRKGTFRYLLIVKLIMDIALLVVLCLTGIKTFFVMLLVFVPVEKIIEHHYEGGVLEELKNYINIQRFRNLNGSLGRAASILGFVANMLLLQFAFLSDKGILMVSILGFIFGSLFKLFLGTKILKLK